MQHLIIRSPPSTSPNQSPYNTFLSGNQLRLAASSVAYQRQPSSGCESQCHLSSLVSLLLGSLLAQCLCPLATCVQKPPENSESLSSWIRLTWRDYIFHCCFLGRSHTSVETSVKATRVRFFLYDIIPCDLSTILL